jgi:photosystem II stability/assembly factor-like uncharacterized protein
VRSGCDFKAIYFSDKFHGWAVGSQGEIIATHDGGRVWRQQLKLESGVLRAVSFVDARNGWATGAVGRVFVTEDGGDTWQENDAVEQVGLVPRATFLRDVAFLDKQTGWIVGETKHWPLRFQAEDEEQTTLLLFTEDGGKSWLHHTLQVPGTLKSTCVVDTQHAYIAGSTLYRTDDAGRSWTDVSGPPVDAVNSVDFFDVARGWAVASGSFHRTLDGGANWERINCPARTYLQSVRFVDAEHGWAVGFAEDRTSPSNGIFSTANGGQDWEEVVLFPVPRDPHTFLAHRFAIA